MKIKYLHFFFELIICTVILLFLTTSCQEKPSKPTTKPLKITLKPVNYSIQGFFEDLTLQEYAYSNYKAMFSPRGTRLGGKTTGIPESDKNRISRLGTHLHLNLDNQQHYLSNKNILNAQIEDGSHRLFAFICGSNYTSIKNPKALLCKSIIVRQGQLIQSKSIEQAHIIYNAPLSSVEYQDSQKIILDFVLYNTQIAAGQNYVELRINDQKITQFDSCRAYYLEGLPAGEHQLELSLYDAEAKLLAPPVGQTIKIQATKKR